MPRPILPPSSMRPPSGATLPHPWTAPPRLRIQPSTRQTRRETPRPMSVLLPWHAFLDNRLDASDREDAPRTRCAMPRGRATALAPVRPRPKQGPRPLAYLASPSCAGGGAGASQTKSATRRARATAHVRARTTAGRCSCAFPGSRSRATVQAAASRTRCATGAAPATARAFASAMADRPSAKRRATARLFLGCCLRSVTSARTATRAACTTTASSGFARRATATSGRYGLNGYRSLATRRWSDRASSATSITRRAATGRSTRGRLPCRCRASRRRSPPSGTADRSSQRRTWSERS